MIKENERRNATKKTTAKTTNTVVVLLLHVPTEFSLKYGRTEKINPEV